MSYHILASISRTVKSGRDRISGILRYAALRDNWIVRVARNDLCITTSTDYFTGDRLPDGIIGDDIPRVTLSKIKGNMPFVVVDKTANPQGIRIDAEVSIDNEAIGRKGAELFLTSGLRNLAFVGVRQKREAFHQTMRCKFFQKCAKESGATFNAFLPDGAVDTAKDLDDLAMWLVSLPTPCGVMAYNDSRAQSVIDACHMMHLKIPEQIQIIGVDNEVEICENMQPTLTSILPDFYGAGCLAAQMLDDIFTNGRPRKTRKATYGIKSVIVRESTQDLKGGGRLVGLAREFIRLHAHEKISVKDVASALNVSRRTLENRFREVLECGVADVLRKEKIERVQRLLDETNRTISDIALDSGFSSYTHLASLFKETFGVTMSEYRNHKIPPDYLSPTPTQRTEHG